MKAYTTKELKAILKLHQKWLNDEVGGIRANLEGADLTRADLTGAILSGADLTRANLTDANLTRAILTRAILTGVDLSGANLTGAILSGADLTRANLTDANLTRANLTGADLTGVDLSGANLTDANLTNLLGNMRHIKSVQAEKYAITYTATILQIGCKRFTVDEWKNFDDDTISKMDSGAIEWWAKWKPIIIQIIEMSPC